VDGREPFCRGTHRPIRRCAVNGRVAYYLLEQAIIRAQGQDSILQQAVGRDWKGKVSVVLYLVAIAVALHAPRIADAVLVALCCSG